MKKENLIFVILGLSFFVKLVLSFTIPIVGDEAYYWFWGQNIQLSYFDHPGMVAWLSAISNNISFLPNWFALRALFCIVSTISFWVWIKCFLISNADESVVTINKSILTFSIFYLLNPLLGIGGILVTPDTPLLLFWALSHWALLTLLIKPHKKYYALLGLFLGLGFCSKYHIVLFPITMLISLMVTKKIQLIKFKYVWITVVFGLVFSLPVIIWNYNNDFASFKFQLNHGLNSTYEYQFWWTSTYLLGQILIFNPMILINIFQNKKISFNKIGSLSQWCFFLYSSLKAKVEANWPITAHATALLDVNIYHKKTIKMSLVYNLILWIGAIIFIFTPQFNNKLLQTPTSQTVKILNTDIQNLEPLYGPTYQLSSLITLMTGKKIYKLKGLSRFDFYDTLPDSTPQSKLFYTLKYDITSWPEAFDKTQKRVLKTYPELKLTLYELKSE